MRAIFNPNKINMEADLLLHTRACTNTSEHSIVTKCNPLLHIQVSGCLGEGYQADRVHAGGPAEFDRMSVFYRTKI